MLENETNNMHFSTESAMESNICIEKRWNINIKRPFAQSKNFLTLWKSPIFSIFRVCLQLSEQVQKCCINFYASPLSWFVALSGEQIHTKLHETRYLIEWGSCRRRWMIYRTKITMFHENMNFSYLQPRRDHRFLPQSQQIIINRYLLYMSSSSGSTGSLCCGATHSL